MFSSARLRHAVLAAVVAALGSGCAGFVPQPAPAASAASGEWVTGPVDLRKATALVRVTPPVRLKATLETLAARIADEDVGDFLRGAAGGGFGSGFLVVHRDASGTAAFVVTNRHVVAGSDEAEITFGDGTTYKACPVVLASTTDDVAVLALPDAAAKAYGAGLKLAEVAPTERLTVVATGYPGIGGRPSFQMTEGKISNARFSMPEVGLAEPLVQHTAAIDPGSSGGPLTNEKGEVVGVNVMLLRSRNAAFFAVPSSAVVDVVRRAHRLSVDRRSPTFLANELTSTCASLSAELSSPSAGIGKLAPFVSNQLVAVAGLESYDLVSRSALGKSVTREFFHDPVAAMRVSVLFRLVAGTTDGKHPVTCAAPNPSDLAAIDDGRIVRVPLHASYGDAELSWRFENGGWRIVGFDTPGIPQPEEPKEPAKSMGRVAKGSPKKGK